MKYSTLVGLFFTLGLFVVPVTNKMTGMTAQKIIGSTLEDLRRLKHDCEKSLPRDQECVLVYEYTPVKKAEK